MSITKNDRIAYDLYWKDTPPDTPVIVIEGFIKYKTMEYKKYYTYLRKEKLKKLNEICQKSSS